MIDALIIIWTFLIGMCVGICMQRKPKKKFTHHKVKWYMNDKRPETPIECKTFFEIQNN